MGRKEGENSKCARPRLLLAELEANGEPDCYEAGLYRDVLGLV